MKITQVTLRYPLIDNIFTADRRTSALCIAPIIDIFRDRMRFVWIEHLQ
jgi:hypothetical protein